MDMRYAWWEPRPGGRRRGGIARVTQKASEWWAGAPAEKRAFFRDVGGLLGLIKPRQVLELRFSGSSFQPWLTGECKEGEASELDLRARSVEPEDWWGGLPLEAREFFSRTGTTAGASAGG